MNYIDILNDPKVIEIYKKIDASNDEPFSHGMQHIKNVCNIMNELCDTLKIDKDMKDALLIAAAFHDLGHGQEDHGLVAMKYVIENYKELESNKYYDEILRAIRLHGEDSKDSDSLFIILLQAADKFDFTKNRLEENKTFFTEKVEKVEFIYDDNYFGLNIITKDIDNFEELFLGLKFFHRIINIVKVIANKLDKKPIIKENNEIMKNVNFD